MQVLQTQRFINADPEQIQIIPEGEKVSDGAGGYTDTPGQPALPITVRLIPQSDKVAIAAASEGSYEKTEYVLMAMPDTPFKKDDLFDWRGDRWRISAVHDMPEYEKKADVVLHAG